MHSFFVDSLNAISSQLQSNAIHILTQPKRSSQKIQSFVMQLTQFKCGVISLLQSMLKQFNTSPALVKQKTKTMLVELEQQLLRNNDKLTRYRLHQILKRKIAKHKKQSMIESVVNREDNSFMELQKSYTMLEKDLGIEPEQESIMSRLEISSIFHRAQDINSLSPNKEQILKDYSIIGQVSSLPLQNSQIMSQVNQVDEKIKNENISLINVQSQSPKLTQTSQKMSKTTKNPATIKKTKKTVFSKMQTSKEGLLGNLLEQSYNLCLDKQ